MADHIDVLTQFVGSVDQIAYESFGVGDVLMDRDIRVSARGTRISANCLRFGECIPLPGALQRRHRR
jgi:hypothetical protein